MKTTAENFASGRDSRGGNRRGSRASTRIDWPVKNQKKKKILIIIIKTGNVTTVREHERVRKSRPMEYG